MKKIVCILFAVVFANYSYADSGIPKISDDIDFSLDIKYPENVHNSILLLTSQNFSTNMTWLGTAFFISESLVLTAYHVVHDSEIILLQSNNRNLYLAEVFHFNKEEDYALLRITEVLLKAPIRDESLTLRVRKNNELSEVYTAGFTKGILTYARGIKFNGSSALDSYSYDFPSGLVGYGASGGPIFDKDGNVIGLISRGTTSAGATDLVIGPSSDTIFNDLKKIRSGDIKP